MNVRLALNRDPPAHPPASEDYRRPPLWQTSEYFSSLHRHTRMLFTVFPVFFKTFLVLLSVDPTQGHIQLNKCTKKFVLPWLVSSPSCNTPHQSINDQLCHLVYFPNRVGHQASSDNTEEFQANSIGQFLRVRPRIMLSLSGADRAGTRRPQSQLCGSVQRPVPRTYQSALLV